MQYNVLAFVFIISLSISSCSNSIRHESVQRDDTTNLPKKIQKTATKQEIQKTKKIEKKSSGLEIAKPVSNHNEEFSLRKHQHVTEFYKRISWPATQLCVNNNVPPAAVLSIAGLESGWNKGYVGRITGNILSLGARGGDAELPALRLPRLISTKEILFDSLVIIGFNADELIWEDRPESLKKDYRPLSIAGTAYQLAYFKYHPTEKAAAQVKNIDDFLTIFISRNSRIPVYREARQLMDSLVNIHGKEILFEQSTIQKFIYTIGGRPNSFNFRETWPKKVMYIVNNAGLAELTTNMYLKNKDFEEAW